MSDTIGETKPFRFWRQTTVAEWNHEIMLLFVRLCVREPKKESKWTQTFPCRPNIDLRARLTSSCKHTDGKCDQVSIKDYNEKDEEKKKKINTRSTGAQSDGTSCSLWFNK